MRQEVFGTKVSKWNVKVIKTGPDSEASGAIKNRPERRSNIGSKKLALAGGALVMLGFFGGIQMAAYLTARPPSLAPLGTGTQNSEFVLQPSQGAELLSQFSAAFETASAKATPSVVSIFVERFTSESRSEFPPTDPSQDFFGYDFSLHPFAGSDFQGESKPTSRSFGAGVIISEDGYILTNSHLVEDAEKLTVVTQRQKSYAAKMIGSDFQTDLAVIKINARHLPAATLGDSDQVKIGQWVIAVGNPFQLSHTVTAGIISAKGRASAGLLGFEDFIQTDALINPGNSGGALTNLDGNVVGINTAIGTPMTGAVGIGFAIPINMAKRIMAELIENGKVTRGYLGVVSQDIDEDLARALKLKGTKGALVGDVMSGSPAEKAGIKRGDIIAAFNGETIEDSLQLRSLIAQARPKTLVTIMLLRGGRKIQVKAVLTDRPNPQAARPEADDIQNIERLGLLLQTLTPGIAAQLGYQNNRGVVVIDVMTGGAAEAAGLQPGDLIQEVNQVQVHSVGDFNRAVSSLKPGDIAALLVHREENTRFVALEIL